MITKSTSYKRLFSILIFLFVFLDFPIKSKENNLNKKFNFLRRLDGTSSNKGISMNLTVINNNDTCDDNTTIIPFLNSNLNFDGINITVDDDFSVIECSAGSKGNLTGLNYTAYKSKDVSSSRLLATSENQDTITITVTLVYEKDDFSSLFENQPNIKEVKFIAEADDLKITSLSSMFANCSNLENVDFGNYTFKGVEDLSYIFENCTNLKTVSFYEDVSILNLTSVNNVEGMFNGCKSLTIVNLTAFTFENVAKANNLFNGCESLTNVTFSENIASENLKEIDGMFEGCEKIESIKIEYFNFSKVEKMNRLFKGCKYLKEAEFNPNVQIDKIKDFSNVFDGCENLTTLNLSKIKFDNVEKMSNLFNDCKNLDNVTFPTDLDVSKVTTIENLFAGCESLEKFNFSIFNFQKLEDASNLLKGAKNLKNVTFGDFNCKNCKSISGLLEDCVSLENIDLSKFETSDSLVDVSSAFSGCSKLKTLNLDGFIFGKNCDAKEFLKGCPKLEYLNLANSKIPGTINYTEMFDGFYFENVNINIDKAEISKSLMSFFKSKNAKTFGTPIIVDEQDINKKSSGGLSGGAIAGIVVASVVTVVVVAAVTVVTVTATTTAAAGGAAVATASVASGAVASHSAIATGAATTASLV